MSERFYRAPDNEADKAMEDSLLFLKAFIGFLIAALPLFYVYDLLGIAALVVANACFAMAINIKTNLIVRMVFVVSARLRVYEKAEEKRLNDMPDQTEGEDDD